MEPTITAYVGTTIRIRNSKAVSATCYLWRTLGYERPYRRRVQRIQLDSLQVLATQLNEP